MWHVSLIYCFDLFLMLGICRVRSLSPQWSEALSVRFCTSSLARGIQTFMSTVNEARAVCTVLSWTSTHGRLQLKCQKLRVGCYTKEVLEWSSIYTQAATQDAELATRGYWIDLHRHFACASLRPARWWKRLYCTRKRTDFYPHCQASAAFVTCSAWISCRKLRMLQMRLWTGVCETLMPDVMLAEAHQNDHSYVHELSGPI